MADYKNILPGKEDQLTDDELLRYLNLEMSAEDKLIFEKKINGSFESDAIAGLQQIKDTKKLHKHLNQLQKKLPKLLLSKKQRLEKRKVKELPWINLTVIILLLLCIITYVIIRMKM